MAQHDDPVEAWAKDILGENLDGGDLLGAARRKVAKMLAATEHLRMYDYIDHCANGIRAFGVTEEQEMFLQKLVEVAKDGWKHAV